MENNNQPPLPPTPPPAPPAPEQPLLPTPPAPPQPQVASPAPITPGSLSTPAKSSKGLVVGIISVIVVLVVAVVAWFMLFSPTAQAKKASTAFMKALTTKDLETVYELAEAEDEATKKFLEGAATASEGSFTLKENTMKDGTGYFLYDLSNETGKQGRTTVEKQDGKYKVSGYVFGSDNLALVPGSSNNDTTEGTDEADEAAPAAAACLVQSDFDAWYKKDYGKTATEYGFNFHKAENAYSTNVHFKPDSLEYTSATESGTLQRLALLAKDPSVAPKQFTIKLRASIGTVQSDDDFANKRAEKVKSELVAMGVPADKIAIEDPGTVADYGSNDPNSVSQQTARNVVIKFDPTCTGAPAANGR